MKEGTEVKKVKLKRNFSPFRAQNYEKISEVQNKRLLITKKGKKTKRCATKTKTKTKKGTPTIFTSL